MEQKIDSVGGVHLIPTEYGEKERHFAPEQTYTKKYLKILREDYNIFYDADSCHAVKIIPRKNINPLIHIFGEDDGCLFASDVKFDAYWAKGLIRNLQKALDEINLD